MRQRPHNRFRILNTNLPPRLPCLLLDRRDSMYNKFSFNAYIHIYIYVLYCNVTGVFSGISCEDVEVLN